ncbi:hypothetical protein CPB86DRAFT_700718 [Serendipita vermifera]|nr:hypothetical protein CPB86DRAFT_700718 [Serendipita vermifera]
MDSDLLQVHLQSFRQQENSKPEVKVYPDVVYHNYFKAGMSVLFSPETGYKPSSPILDPSKLIAQSVDLYNTSGQSKHQFSSFRALPFAIIKEGKGRLDITGETDGKTFVEFLGEPARKGGGGGPSSGSIEIWCEWPQQGLMVEFALKGPQAWDRGKDAPWKTITVFAPLKE